MGSLPPLRSVSTMAPGSPIPLTSVTGQVLAPACEMKVRANAGSAIDFNMLEARYQIGSGYALVSSGSVWGG